MGLYSVYRRRLPTRTICRNGAPEPKRATDYVPDDPDDETEAWDFASMGISDLVVLEGALCTSWGVGLDIYSVFAASPAPAGDAFYHGAY